MTTVSLPAFQVVRVRPRGIVHSEALTEFAECVYFGLRRLGVPVYHNDQRDCSACQIVFGAHLLDEAGMQALPSDAIIYNLTINSTA